MADDPDPAHRSATQERLADQLGWYETNAKSNQLWFKSFKVAQIVVAAAIPSAAALGASVGVAAVLGSVVVVLEGVQSLFGFQTNWTTYRKTAEALKREQYLYLAQAAQYAGDDREKVLAVIVESLISDETTRWASTQIEPQQPPST
jgi:Protein of unknown function (DUF4231)